MLVVLDECLPAWLVDPRGIGEPRRLGLRWRNRAGLAVVGRVQAAGALGSDLGCGAVVHRGGGVQPDPGVAVLVTR